MNKINYILVAAIACSSLSGCGLYTSYERADEETLTDSLYTYIEATNDTTNIASLSWRELFTDSHLQTLIEQALANNTNLAVARLTVEQAKVALKTAKLAYVPTLNLGATGGASSFQSTNTQTYALSASSSWEIDLFGKLRNAKRQSQAALEQSEAYKQAVQTDLIATIANSYYSLLMLDEQLRINEGTLTNWEESLRAMEALKKAGVINQNSVLQSQASVLSLQSSIVTTKQQIAALENTLSALLAIPSQEIERGVITEATFPSELVIGVPVQLLSNRPDVRVAEYNLEQAFYATNEARASLYPSISLSGSIGYTNSGGTGIVNPGDILYNAAASVLQPIFNGGALRGQLNIAKATQEQALLQFKQAVLDAGAEVNTALIAWQSAQERLVYDKQQIEVLQQAVANSELLMKHGNINYLEVLTAQLTLLQTELSFASDKYAEIAGAIDLYRALGGGGK